MENRGRRNRVQAWGEKETGDTKRRAETEKGTERYASEGEGGGEEREGEFGAIYSGGVTGVERIRGEEKRERGRGNDFLYLGGRGVGGNPGQTRKGGAGRR